MSRILIVEDEEAIAELEKDYLELNDFEVKIENSGDTGLAAALAEDFDLIILDLMLPGIPGEELVSLFGGKIPVIVLSAKSGLDSKVDVLSAGADDYMCKPFDLPELLVHQRGAPADIALVLHRDHGVVLSADGNDYLVSHVSIPPARSLGICSQLDLCCPL